MAKFNILLIVCQLIALPILSGSSQGSGGFEDLVSAYIQQYGDSAGNTNNIPNLVSHFVGSLMQGDNAQNLAGLFSQAGGNGAGDLLAGLGSLLGGQNGQIDPSLIGNMVSMFTQSMAQNQPPKDERKKRSNNDNNINFDNILGLASSLLGNKDTASLLPVIMNTISSFTNDQVNKVSHDHKDHASFLPPYLEKLHLYWDLFINSELGKMVWEKSGMRKMFKAFTGPDGKFSFDLVMKNFENQSYRRHWIKASAKYLTDTVVHIAKPEVYQKYLATAQYVINGFLDAQGFPKSAHFSTKKPEKSIATAINHMLKKYMDITADVTEYVKPAVDYLRKTLKMAEAASQKLVNRSDYNALADRMTDTLNLEFIEPVLRVYRAYKHSVAAPHCQEHLMCLVNKKSASDQKGIPGFKTGLTKFSSLVASAALSFQDGKGFWDLYNAIQSDVNCEAAYPADCSSFHEHEQKVTTEVYHSEL